jgi:hypothetical protein
MVTIESGFALDYCIMQKNSADMTYTGMYWEVCRGVVAMLKHI